MTRRRIFISSVQKELAQEREGLRDYLHADPLLRRFFDVFLFEDVPAADRSAERGYLKEVKQCDIFLGLFANDYGRENRQGLSSTELEFNAATEAGKTRLIYVKGANDRSKHPKMKALILRAGNELIRRRFDGVATLKPAVYASLVDYLEEERLISTAPFDASPCADAKIDDLDVEAMQAFIRLARHARNFPLPESTRPVKLLAHLNLLVDDHPANAAMLLFGISIGFATTTIYATAGSALPHDAHATGCMGASASRLSGRTPIRRPGSGGPPRLRPRRRPPRRGGRRSPGPRAARPRPAWWCRARTRSGRSSRA